MIGTMIGALRTQHRLTQKELADKIGVSRSSIAKYELNQAYPTISILIAIADYFDVSLDYLCGRKSGDIERLSNNIALQLHVRDEKHDEKKLESLLRIVSVLIDEIYSD